MTLFKETIRPSADLRNHYSEVSRECKENGTVSIITVNGRGDTVSIGYDDWQRIKARLELLEMLSQAEQQVKDGRTAPISDTFESIRSSLLARKESK